MREALERTRRIVDWAREAARLSAAEGPARAARRAGWLLAAAALAFQLACSPRYGFFRDELYFIACGRHLAWGYVDQPPLIALAARLSEAAFGTWLPGLRLLPALSAAGLVLLCGAMARWLGGGTWAVALAGIGAALAPELVFRGHTLTMNAFEPLLWGGMAFLVLRIAEGASPRLWLGAGALAGVALLDKHSAAFWLAALLGALALGRQRRLLGSGWLWAGAGLAALLVLPHAIWQVVNDFPMLELLRNGQLRKNAPFSAADFLGWQPLGLGPAFPLALAGLLASLRGALAPRIRPAALAFALTLLLLLALKGKGYYLGPAYPPLIAAGAAALERWLGRAVGPAALALAAAGLALAPLTAPVLPPPLFVRYAGALGLSTPATERHEMGALPQHMADQFGWEGKVAAVERAWRSLPPGERARAGILAQNFGEAGAIDVLGRPRGLPEPFSCHNSYWVWSRRRPVPDVLVILGGREEDHRRAFAEVVLVERIAHDPWVMPYEDRLGVWVARRPRVDLAALLEGCRSFI